VEKEVLDGLEESVARIVDDRFNGIIKDDAQVATEYKQVIESIEKRVEEEAQRQGVALTPEMKIRSVLRVKDKLVDEVLSGAPDSMGKIALAEKDQEGVSPAPEEEFSSGFHTPEQKGKTKADEELVSAAVAEAKPHPVDKLAEEAFEELEQEDEEEEDEEEEEAEPAAGPVDKDVQDVEDLNAILQREEEIELTPEEEKRALEIEKEMRTGPRRSYAMDIEQRTAALMKKHGLSAETLDRFDLSSHKSFNQIQARIETRAAQRLKAKSAKIVDDAMRRLEESKNS
jgi:hypothetical protein